MNINDYVSVVLTEFGAEVYNEWAAHYPLQYRPASKEEGDTLRESLWYVMQIFGGKKIGLGMKSPFKECQMELC